MEQQTFPWTAIMGWSLLIILVAFCLSIAGIAILYGYNYPFTGSGIDFPPNAMPPSEPRPKTLWDWMDLCVVPFSLALVAAAFSLIQARRDTRITEIRRKIDQQISEDNLREAAVQVYFDKMTELLLMRGSEGTQLSEYTPFLEGRSKGIASARTLTVLRTLSGDGKRKETDGERKGAVVRFLYETELIIDNSDDEGPPLDLKGADLGGVILRHADLIGAKLANVYLAGSDLGKAHLVKADLTNAILRDAHMQGTFLQGAFLSGADLCNADLRGAYLTDAQLDGAKLMGANLTNATVINIDFSNADLRGATIDINQIPETKLKGAFLPNGEKRPE